MKPLRRERGRESDSRNTVAAHALAPAVLPKNVGIYIVVVQEENGWKLVLATGADGANGLYSNATVWVGAGYAANSTGATYSFPGVAIAGQINGKFAVFLIGVDSTQPWAVYLLQSN